MRQDCSLLSQSHYLEKTDMFKKLLLVLAALIATMGFAFAQVEANKADQAALDGIKGIGPKMSKTIIDERKKNGDFKDWSDFENRVKGVKEKRAAKLSEAGLTVNGQPRPGTAPVSASASKGDKKAKTADTKATDTKDAKPAAAKKEEPKK
jgi:competence protein ComEA